MKKKLLLLGLLGVVAAAVLDGRAAALATSWGKAIEVPGTAKLNSGGSAQVSALSCAAAGQCVAGGVYKDGSSHSQAFVVSERRGRWGKAIEVPGTAILNSGGSADVDSVSCPAAGQCVAGGSYRDGSGGVQAFVVNERRDHWSKAEEVPGTAHLNSGGVAGVTSVACAAVGQCVAGGGYLDGSGGYQAFVASEKRGRWGKAVEVPGTATLNAGGNAYVQSVSCAAAGQCVGGGFYASGPDEDQAFVVSERHGRWGKAVEVPGTAILNDGDYAYVNSVSCAAAGQCAAGGVYKDGSGHSQAFVVSEKRGRWGKAIEVPGTAILNSGGGDYVGSVSCAAAGECLAGGSYTDGLGRYQAFVASERRGRWGKAVEVPGTANLNKRGDADVSSVSCAAVGQCVAGGSYQDGSAGYQAFLVTERRGRWGKAVEVPGTAHLNGGGSADVGTVSCVAAGECAAGGTYTEGSAHRQAFVVTGKVVASKPKR